MLNLMLHCGGRRVDREQIEQAPTPSPTRSWQPIPHQRLLELIEFTLTSSGFRIVNQAHALWGEGTRYFGLLEVQNGSAIGEYGLVVGLRNSHDKGFPAGLAVGSGVFVCDNLAFSAEVTLARRHTRFISRDLPQLVHRAVGGLGDLRAHQDRRIDCYKNALLDDRSVHDLVIRSLDAQVLPVTQVPTVISEWRAPSHEEFADSGFTGWRLFNAFTEALKGRNLEALPRRTRALHGLLDSACGLAA